MKRIAIILINFYQKRISPLKPPMCRFTPTCSQYAKDAFQTHGFWIGGLYTTKRLLRCHPFNPGGADPVPDKRS